MPHNYELSSTATTHVQPSKRRGSPRLDISRLTAAHWGETTESVLGCARNRRTRTYVRLSDRGLVQSRLLTTQAPRTPSPLPTQRDDTSDDPSPTVTA